MDRKIKLTTGGFCLIDESNYHDFSKYKWGVDNNGYVRRWRHVKIEKYKYKTITEHMHKLILNVDSTIDHINGNKMDNRLINLRAASKSQNAINSGKCLGKKQSIYRGVSKHKNKWRAYAEYKNKKYSIGVFETEIDAAIARDNFWTKTGELFVKNIP